jgi:hypothetical protein
MSSTKATTGNIGTLDAASLTGAAMPAISGAALTNIPGVTNSLNDPAANTNPSAGIGAAWLNTSTGSLYCCTDATADANIWVDVSDGYGAYGRSFGGNGPGSTAGYVTGGYHTGGYPVAIDKFLFASGGALTDHGDITHSGRQAGGCSSATHGYALGGNGPSNIKVADIEKYSFASANTVSDHGSCRLPLTGNVGSCSSLTDGFQCGGSPASSNRIEKMSFASNVTMSHHSHLTIGRYVNGGGVSSDTHGYTAGGNTHPAQAIGAPIDRFDFSSQSNATDHGDLTGNTIRYGGAGISSSTHGYYAGGHGGPPTGYWTEINKYAYTSNTTASDHADLSVGPHANAGCSGTTEGYSAGGDAPPGGQTTLVEKFSYASQNTVASHSNLSVGKQGASTAQV